MTVYFHVRGKEERRAYQKEYYKKLKAEHPEKIKAYRKKYAKRQAIYYRKWYKENGRNRTDQDREKILEWIQEHPERIKIKGRLRYAIIKGDIKRPDICPKCDRKARIQAHHYNYDNYMNFIWLCSSCHKKEHINNREQ